MTQYRVTDSQLSSIANAIRTKGSTSAPLSFPDGFVNAVNAIPSGSGANLGSLEVSVNGEYTPTGGLDGFNNVVVSVPQSGITPTGNISISQNGTYNVTSFANAVVSVEGGLDSDRITLSTSVSKVAGFAGNTIITEVYVSNCNNVGSSAFTSCPELTLVSFPNASSIPQSGFYRCSKLSFANFLNATLVSGNAFDGCTSLETLIAPNVETLNGYNCFSGINVSTLSFPKLKTITERVFLGHTKLESLYLLSDAVVSMGSTNNFANSPMSNSSYLGHYGSIYVPASLVDDYKAATNWSVYSDRITAYVE